jgi:pyrroline-5-carboxylate reductase
MTNLQNLGPVMLVGAGKMGLSLAQGWLNAGLPASNLVLVDPTPSEQALALAADNGTVVNKDSAQCVGSGG